MKKALSLHYDQHEGMERAFLMREGAVVDCFFNSMQAPQQTGAIYRGTVARMLKGQKSAFLAIGKEEQAFLGDVEQAHIGETLLVQVKSEMREDKGYSLTRAISLPGVSLIYQPFGKGLHYSRRLGADGETLEPSVRKMLEAMPGGWIIRSAAVTVSREHVIEEAEALFACGARLKQEHAEAALLLNPLSAFEQAVLYGVGQGLSHLVLDQEADVTPVTGYMREALPSLLGQLRISTAKQVAEQGDLEHFYTQLKARKIDLPRGGSVIFEHLSTFHAIDVNAGDRTHFLEINLEAAALIMQHLRWRNMGGMIFIDFLKMKRKGDRVAVAKKLDEMAGHDPVTSEIYGFTRMGLFEISRARRGFGLHEMPGINDRDTMN